MLFTGMPKIVYTYRKDYDKGILTLEDLLPDPFDMFSTWFEDAAKNGIEEPNAMVLATVGKNYRPSLRIVLLRESDNIGFIFFTNYQSKKGKQIEENPAGSLLFPWHSVQRQIRIEGYIEKLSEKASNEYFQSRPIESLVSAWISPQSREIHSREFLEDSAQKFKFKNEGKAITRPPFWGGYKLIPDLFEFWQGRANRLHDRFEYYREEEDWKLRRLAP
jgi:pyridoxamine 5'-phosphate oxidase